MMPTHKMILTMGARERNLVKASTFLIWVLVLLGIFLFRKRMVSSAKELSEKAEGFESSQSFDFQSKLFRSTNEVRSDKQPSAVQTEENQDADLDNLVVVSGKQFVSSRWLPQMRSIGSSEDNLSPSQRASDANQEMDRKLADADLSSAYAEEMIATWRDRTNHELVRNFAVQHLERYARECVVRGTWDPASADAADVRAALEEAVLETGTSVGGAALLALARLSEIDPDVDRARLGARASSLVSDPSAPAAPRVSAAQVCGVLLVRSALPALRSLSSGPATPTPLRLAADHAAKAIADR